MKLDLVNNFFNSLKENKFIQNFKNELSDCLEKKSVHDNKWNDLLANDLEISNQKIISKYKNEMLLERANILQNYASKTKDKGEMYYVYNINSDRKDEYNLCVCESNKSNKVITMKIEDLPKNASLGSILRKKGEKFILEKEDTKVVENQINTMIEEKIKEQNKYLDSKRIEGHIYEVDEKDFGRIWLYDLNNKVGEGIEEIEEIEFPKELYDIAKKWDKFIYQDGEYKKI